MKRLKYIPLFSVFDNLRVLSLHLAKLEDSSFSLSFNLYPNPNRIQHYSMHTLLVVCIHTMHIVCMHSTLHIMHTEYAYYSRS